MRRLHRTVMHAVHGDALGEPVEIGLRHPAMGAHAIAPEPAGAWQLQMPGERAVGGEQQQPFGVEVEPPHRDHARQIGRQRLEHGLPPLRILVAGDEALRLVVAPQPRQSRLGEGLAVHRDDVAGRHDTAGVVSTLPLTATRPCSIHVSASRREQSPAWAMALAIRIGSAAFGTGVAAARPP